MKNIVGIIALIICLLIVADLMYMQFGSNKNTKIGIVRMEEFVYGFDGMKEASANYSSRLNSWNSQIDSIEIRLKGLYDEIKLDSINSDEEKLQKDLRKFSLLSKSYYEYQQNIKNKAQEDDKNLTTGIINQLNDYTKQYALENKFDVIINNTQMKNVAYAKDGIDITDQLLEYANSLYNNEN